MSTIKLKNGKSKLMVDETDLQELIRNELGYDAEDKFIGIIEKMNNLNEYIKDLEKVNGELEKEIEDWENANISLQDDLDELEKVLKDIKKEASSLKALSQDEYELSKDLFKFINKIKI